MCVRVCVRAATSDEEMTMWVKGLTWLVADTLRSPTPLQIERSEVMTPDCRNTQTHWVHGLFCFFYAFFFLSFFSYPFRWLRKQFYALDRNREDR